MAKPKRFFNVRDGHRASCKAHCNTCGLCFRSNVAYVAHNLDNDPPCVLPTDEERAEAYHEHDTRLRVS